MILYKDCDTKIIIEDVNNISSRAFKDNIFDLLDGIMKKNYKKIFECMNDLKVLKEEPIKIISMLGKQITFIYRVKILSDRYNSNEEISKVLNCHPYRVKLAKECDYMVYELEDLIKKLHNLDYEIKSGKKDKILALEKIEKNLISHTEEIIKENVIDIENAKKSYKSDLSGTS